ncbi:hypothetical protein M408DRAFT_329708 [Serendipita vermifera MAFF 305830]|uniref:Uncharacterized protein n=1 Tax=Serendipita vermifera MAFF 305830 TaxID=933852 RepID=A0A0C2WP97_SERVB|nr:hypothetical protein M408DRAFT_329708 [Serendipita vermifera MAFF 305830]
MHSGYAKIQMLVSVSILLVDPGSCSVKEVLGKIVILGTSTSPDGSLFMIGTPATLSPLVLSFSCA